MTKREKGFTLIELLVVIAIIGILSSVVLASLSAARNKGNNAKIKAQLSGLRAAAEIYYSNQNSYGTASDQCNASMFSDAASGMAQYTASTNYPTGATLSCHTSGTAYAVSALLTSAEGTANAWCVDSTGSSKGEAANLTNGQTACP